MVHITFQQKKGKEGRAAKVGAANEKGNGKHEVQIYSSTINIVSWFFFFGLFNYLRLLLWSSLEQQHYLFSLSFAN